MKLRCNRGESSVINAFVQTKIMLTVIVLRPAWSIPYLGRLEAERTKCKVFFRKESIQAISGLAFASNIYFNQSAIKRTIAYLRYAAAFGVTNSFILLFADTSGHSGTGASIRASKIDFDLKRK